jgi:HAD superfamily hydrolase (TIGR01509 family)
MRYAYIFDLDGVLFDTMGAQFECYAHALAEVNVPVDRDQFLRQAGMTGQEQIRYFAEKAGIIVDPDLVYARKQELYKDLRERASAIECNLGLFRALRSAGIPVAVASGSAKSSWLPLLARYGLEVDAAVGPEDVDRGKPSPDLFLCAAEKLGVSPERCVVIEDSEAGIEAAGAAGMKALRFYNTLRLYEPAAPPPHASL